MRKIVDFLILFFLAIVTVLFSVLIYVRYLWPNADYEQIMMTIKDLSPELIVNNALAKDYILGFLFFIVIYPVCYIYLNTKQRLLTATILLFAILYYSGFIYYKIFSSTTSNLYETEYVSSKDVTFNFPEKKRNLLLIYMESFEQNFSKQEHYGQNLIPNLTKLQEEGQHSLAHESLPGSDYSIASLVASQCGVPLRFPKERDIWDTKYFLPGAVCFAEILREAGYKNVMIKAADIQFTKADVFLKAHGFDEALGVNEILPALPNKDKSVYMGTFGGVTDRVLYDFAKKKIESFDDDKPFMLSLFTLDTHVPTVELDKSCDVIFDDLRDSFICADKAVYEFIEWFKGTKYWDNTTVVIVGDHLLPSRIFYKGHPQRGIYNVFLNVPYGLNIDKNKVFSTYDLAPTILESVGANLNPRRLGLGKSMFSDETSLIEKMGMHKLKIRLIQKSEIYKKLVEPNVKRIDVYKDYELKKSINEEQFLEYTDAYSEVMKQYYLDRLNLGLKNYSGGDLKVKLKFVAVASGEILISANNNLITEVKKKQMIRQPVDIEFIVKSYMVKDGKLQFKFRNTSGNGVETQMGISPKELVIEEIK